MQTSSELWVLSSFKKLAGQEHADYPRNWFLQPLHRSPTMKGSHSPSRLFARTDQTTGRCIRYCSTIQTVSSENVG
jgi:hypothetical protein